ncbi:MAG: hypothetical protein WAK71_15475 [Streptosporangiaceae bacterium]
MRVEISASAVQHVASRGGRLWVWAARPRLCCSGAPAWMHAATDPPDDQAGFAEIPATSLPAGITVFFRPVGGLRPGVLEVGIRGRRHPAVAGYWDGCLMAMVG